MNNINKYLKNKLPEVEAEKITKTLLVNAFTEDLKEDWAKVLEEKYKVVSPQKKRFKLSILKGISIAATLLILLVVGQFFQPSTVADYQALVDDYTEEPHKYSSNRGAALTTIRTNFARAYISKDYAQAIQFYEQMIKTEKADIADYFYGGLCYLYHNQPKLAIKALQKAQTMQLTNSIRSKGAIKWYLCLAYVKAGKLKLAKQDLNTIVKEEVSYSSKAKKLLNAIE